MGVWNVREEGGRNVGKHRRKGRNWIERERNVAEGARVEKENEGKASKVSSGTGLVEIEVPVLLYKLVGFKNELESEEEARKEDASRTNQITKRDVDHSLPIGVYYDCIEGS